MHRILVGVDGSRAALDALAWSADTARRAALELVAARVFAPTQAELPPDQDTALRDRQHEELDGWCAGLPGDAPTPRTLLVGGGPADALLEAARDEDADLLVVGGRGAGGFLNLHLGSVAHHLSHHTDRPLTIVGRRGAAPVRHLVVGVDGSPGSLAAVEFCADLASRLDVAVTAVHALDPFVQWLPDTDPDSWASHARDEVRAWSGPIEKAGVHLEVDVDRDIHPVAALARALDAREGAVAVVGTRGLGGFSGLRLGRVPLQLVHHTGAAVILVPPRQKA